jgi:hypothetical protein
VVSQHSLQNLKQTAALKAAVMRLGKENFRELMIGRCWRIVAVVCVVIIVIVVPIGSGNRWIVICVFCALGATN